MENWSKLMEPGATPPLDILSIFKYVPKRLFGIRATRSRNVGKAMDARYG